MHIFVSTNFTVKRRGEGIGEFEMLSEVISYHKAAIIDNVLCLRFIFLFMYLLNKIKSALAFNECSICGANLNRLFCVIIWCVGKAETWTEKWTISCCTWSGSHSLRTNERKKKRVCDTCLGKAMHLAVSSESQNKLRVCLEDSLLKMKIKYAQFFLFNYTTQHLRFISPFKWSFWVF